MQEFDTVQYNFFTSPIFSQILVVGLVMFMLFLGIWARGALDEVPERMTKRQHLGTLIAGFILMGIPMVSMVQSAFGGDPSEVVASVLTACVPPFASGFTAREQIKNWLSTSSTPQGDVAGPRHA